MAKSKNVQVMIFLERISCVRKSVNKDPSGISRYITQKNRRNTPSRLELIKFCPYCSKQTHRKIKNKRNSKTDIL